MVQRPNYRHDHWLDHWLDYYLLEPDGLLVEEFVLGADFSAIGLDGAGWSAASGWWSSAQFTRGVRTDQALRARVRPVERAEAESAFRRLGGGGLPGEAALRGYFRERQPLRGEQLRLQSVPGRRMYRILCAGQTAAEPARHAGQGFGWELRRIGAGIGWCADLTVAVGAESAEVVAEVVAELLAEVKSAVRRAGLIPVTIERFF
jgi:hypothetical protein